MQHKDKKDKAKNPDPITGAPGSHPVGTGIGAAAGGAATGAAVGTVAGPIGTGVGAAVGAIVGGLAGKGVAEKINPTAEEAYWRENHATQPFTQGRSYDDFGPAYRTGYEGYAEFSAAGATAPLTFEEREAELRRRYEQGYPKLSWENARPATRAAWDRVSRPRGNAAGDQYGSGSLQG